MKNFHFIKGPIVLLCMWLSVATSLGGQTPLFDFLPEPPVLSARQQHFLDVLLAQPTTGSLRFATIDPARFDSSQVLLLNNLLDNGSANADAVTFQNHLERRAEDDISWGGTLDTDPLGSTAFVARAGFVHGLVSLSTGAYAVEPIGEGMHVVYELLREQYPPEGCDHIDSGDKPGKTDPAPGQKPAHAEPAEPGGNDNPPNQTSTTGDCRIRLLVAFTDDVAAANADPLGEIQLATDNFNTANANSLVSHRLELARVLEVSYAETGDAGLDLSRFRGTADGYMDQIHALRDQYDADMCCLVAQNGGGYCGIASAIGATATTAFQVTAYSCAAGNLTFAHEFGHLLNARHDTYVNPTPGTNHGYTYPAGAWRTVMAYNNACSAAGVYCTRLKYWSNPGVNYGGQPMGAAGTSDNESALDAFAATVAAFQAYPASKSFTVTDDVKDGESAFLMAKTALTTHASYPVTIRNGAKATFQAKNSIFLRPGFYAEAGSNFISVLDNCTSNFFGPSDPADERTSDQPGDVPGDQYFALRPNPATAGRATFHCFSAEEEIRKLTFVNLDGRAVLHKTVLVPEGENALQLQIDLPPGVYFVRMSGADSLVKWVRL